MRWTALLASLLLVGCAGHSYAVLVEGRVTSATPSTPRSVRAAIYDSLNTPRHEIEEAAGGDLAPLGNARVDLGFQFDAEETPRFTRTIEVDPTTGLFRALIQGEGSDRLGWVTFVASAPGHEPRAVMLASDPDGNVRRKLLVVLEPVAPPSPPPPEEPP
jgi:hypothetical protein